MAFQDGEADRLERLAQLLGEEPPVARVAMEEAADVAGADAVVRVELLLRRPRQVIALLLLHLVVAEEVGVGGAHALGLAVAHRSRRIIPPMPRGGKRWR